MQRSTSDLIQQLPDLNRRLEVYVSRLPPGADPMTHNIERAKALLSRVALFPMLSMPDDRLPNRPLVEDEQLIGVEIHEALHRFFMTTRPSTGSGPAFDNVIDESQVATGHVNWYLAPDDYIARPGRVPPPTPLRPTVSQRFVMEGKFLFGDPQQSGFHGFAVGRTFPNLVDGRPVLRFAAMVDILEGYGGLYGHLGHVGINGTVEPPEVMRLAVMPAILDFDGHLTTRTAPAALPNLPDPAPDEVFFLCRGETALDNPMSITPMPRGLLLAHADLPLQGLGIDFEIDPRLASHRRPGMPIGVYHANFWVGPLDGSSLIPFQSVGGRFNFYDTSGKPLGRLDANVLEGRAQSFLLTGIDAPSYRFAGIGPMLRGSGIFEDAQGFVTMVGVMSVFPRTMSIYYILRLDDPTGRIREATYKAWGEPNDSSEGNGSSI